jgi:hypothetical protein
MQVIIIIIISINKSMNKQVCGAILPVLVKPLTARELPAALQP